MFTVMTGDCAVGGFGFEGLSVWGDEDRSHKTEGAVTLSYDVGLNVAVVYIIPPVSLRLGKGF